MTRIIRCRRRSIALIVTAEAELVVRAPRHVSLDYIEAIIGRKRAWIERKIAEVARRPKPVVLTAEERARLQREAAAKLFERCGHYSKLTGHEPSAVRISRARSRWGSCGPTGIVSFSWRLALVPPAVADYVVVHELVHLVERNHSPRFWGRVAQIMPDYKLHRRWLREHGHSLAI